jgi:DNA-binding beta-propeller fold protein YncE
VPAGQHARRRRRRAFRLVRTVAILVVGLGAGLWASGALTSRAGGPSIPAATSASHRTTTTTTTTTDPPLQRVPAGPPSDQRHLTLIDTIGGPISPKSVDASDTGLVFAQNMMYRHSVTVYNSAGRLVKTIPDTVDMSQFGFSGHPGTTHGAPVEAAFTPDGKYAYVSNYSMYGTGFGPEGNDNCTPSSAVAAGDTDSYVYRIDTSTLEIDQVIQVGLVPKYLAVSPNGKWLLVSNWCSYNLSIVNIAEAKQVAVLPMGAYPRGIAIAPDSSVAYIAIMGGYDVVKVDLDTLTETGSFYVGYNPRSVVIDPAGRYLYVSLNAPGNCVKVDLSDDRVVASVHTGDADRSLAIATDGLSLYVVNYMSDTMTKIRTSDMSILQNVSTGVNPIGVTYDAMTGDVWVAVYTGEILVFADR